MPQYGIQAMGMLSIHNHSSLTQGGAVPVGSLTGHNTPIHDALDIDADTVDGIDIPSIIANILTNHTKAVHDALNINADQVDGEEANAITTNARVKAHFPDTIANILSNHTKAVHDALNIDADTVDTYHLDQALLQASSPNFAALRTHFLHLQDLDDSHSLNLVCNENLTGNRDFNIIVGNAARTLTLSGNPTLADWFDQSVKQASSVIFGGAVINGKLSLGAPTELTINAGVITVTRSNHTLDGEGDLDDDLNTINGGVDGQILVLRAESPIRDITVMDGAGNIELEGGVNFILSTMQRKLYLFYDALTAGGRWCEINRFTG